MSVGRMDGENATTGLVVFSTYGERQLLAVLYSVVAVVGTLGNCLVLLAVLLSRKLRTVPNVFVVNLSLADLMSVLSMPWQSVAVLSLDGWPLASWVCVLGAVSVMVSIGCSVNTLTLIAINRFVIITQTKSFYQRMYRAHWIALMVAASWIYPAVITGFPLASRFVQLGFDRTFGTCAWDSSHPNAATFAMAVSVAIYPVQFCTIIACYVALFVRLCKHNRTVFNGANDGPTANSMRASTVSGAAAAAALPAVPNPNEQQLNRRRRQTEVTKNLFYVVCAFFVCITPYAICIMRTDTYRLLPYSTVFLYTNSCLNPFIYAKKHSDFRKAFSCILRCKFSSIPGRK